MAIKIPFSGRSHDYTAEEIAALIEAVNTADPLTQGRYRNAFEDKFKRYIGAEYAFTTCNATAALEMTAQLCQFKKGDEIIIPGHTFTSSAYPFIKKGAVPVWADIDPITHVVTAETIERCLTKKTKAVVIVHLYGYVADMPEIMKLAEKYKLIVIEDAAQSIGAEIKGRKSGTFGDFGVFSFHSHKNITTLGEGGMLVVKDKKFSHIIPMLRHNGHCGFNFERKDYWIPAMGNVDLPVLDGEIIWPNNYCLGEVECAVGIKLLDRLDEINVFKRERAIKFIDSLDDQKDLEFFRENSNRHNYHLLTARIKHEKRDQFIKRMSQEKGIQCVVQYYPLYRYDFYKKLGFGKAYCPNCDDFFDNMVSFPFQMRLTDTDIEYIIESTKDILG